VTATSDVVIIGAGQAGLAVSYHLKQAGIPHVVLERGQIGESWRSQRWDSFYLNTPNWANAMPGADFHPEAVDDFSSRDALVAFFERYVQANDLPVRSNSEVLAVALNGNAAYTIQTASDTYRAHAVVLASGGLSRPKVPKIAGNLPAEILSLSAAAYRNPQALPDGAVLVVGGGQSGCQVAEDLLEAGRRVYICASKVGRVPRTYRGRDIFEWMKLVGMAETALHELEDPAMQFAAQPQVSGTDGGHTISYQSLARDGATLLGRASAIDGYTLTLEPNLMECIAYADGFALNIKTAIDTLIEREEVEAEPAAPDPNEPELPDPNGSDRLTTLDLKEAGITSVLWCTGFDADWSWVKVDVFDEQGRPRHQAGVTDSPGLYFIGMPWLAKRKSGLLFGISEDAERICRHLHQHLSLTTA